MSQERTLCMHFSVVFCIIRRIDRRTESPGAWGAAARRQGECPCRSTAPMGKRRVPIAVLFGALDTNGDGWLSYEEAKVALTGAVPLASYRETFDLYDADDCTRYLRVPSRPAPGEYF